MLEAEQPEDRDREVARRPPLLQCIEVGSPASPGSRNLDAKPKRSCLSTQHGVAVDNGGEGVWGVDTKEMRQCVAVGLINDLSTNTDRYCTVNGPFVSVFSTGSRFDPHIPLLR